MLQTRSPGRRTETPMACPRQVTLVESNPADATLITRVFQEANACDRLVHFDDCQRALAHLRSRSEERPMLILLALNMPGESAFPLLAALKADDMLKMVPVVVMAQSNAEHEIAASFSLGAASYVIKSADAGKLREDMATLCTYWTWSELPRL